MTILFIQKLFRGLYHPVNVNAVVKSRYFVSSPGDEELFCDVLFSRITAYRSRETASYQTILSYCKLPGLRHEARVILNSTAASCLDLPTFGQPLNNLTVSVGREAVFTCIVEGLGPYKVAWLRVDTQTILTIASHVITKNHRIAVTHIGHRLWSLHIKDTRQTDSGWYMCQVNTDPMSSITGFLEVVVPPDILDYPTSTDMVVREGSNVTLRCAATGTPEPTVTWRRETGGTISLSNWQAGSIVGPELEITRITRLHMGPYLCIASNGVPPTVSKRILLTVHFQPMVWIENQLVGAYEGQTLTLECRSEAHPSPITYWTKPSNETITNDENYKVETIPKGLYEMTMKLVVKSVRAQDFGSFRCVATNSLGETDGKIKLYRIDKPPTTRRPGTRRESKKTWKIDHNHEKKAVGMKDEPMLKGDEGGDEQIDFQSATASSLFHRHLFTNFGLTAITVILADGLAT